MSQKALEAAAVRHQAKADRFTKHTDAIKAASQEIEQQIEDMAMTAAELRAVPKA